MPKELKAITSIKILMLYKMGQDFLDIKYVMLYVLYLYCKETKYMILRKIQFDIALK